MRFTIHLEGPAPGIEVIPGWLTIPGVIRTEPVTVEVLDRDDLERDVQAILAAHPEFTRATVRPCK